MIKCLKRQIAVEPIYDSDYYNPQSQLIKIPDTSKERCDQGIVKYIGSEVDPSIIIGSHIIFSGYSGTTVKVDDEILIVIIESDVKAIVNEEDNVIPGLYFKGKVDLNWLDVGIKDILSRANPTYIQAEELLRLFALAMNDVLIPAQYENSIKLIAESRSFIDIKEPKRTEFK